VKSGRLAASRAQEPPPASAALELDEHEARTERASALKGIRMTGSVSPFEALS
jgi:hypothetical protein